MPFASKSNRSALVADVSIRVSARSRNQGGLTNLCRALALIAGLSLAALPALASLTATTTALTVTSGGAAVTTVSSGAVITLTATVKAGATPMTVGQVNFCDATAKSCTDSHLLASAQITKAGTATYKFRPGPGSHSYKAEFSGTVNDAPSESTSEALKVTEVIPAHVSIASSGAPGDYTLTASVTATGLPVSPIGKVSFVDTSAANDVLATSSLLSQKVTETFPIAGYTATDPTPQAMAVADLNGDGFLDLATANSNDNTVTILLGNGKGAFKQATGSPITVNGIPYGIVAGDFNGDGVQDLAVSSAIGQYVTILLGKGDGTFSTAPGSPIATGVSLYSLIAGDFNGDGILDLAGPNYEGSSAATVLLGKGDGTFAPIADTGIAGGTYLGIAVADFDGDGALDLALTDFTGVTILMGKGNGTFAQAPLSISQTSAGSYSMAVGDFNGDGIPDLAVPGLEIQPNSYGVVIYLGRGDGTFSAGQSIPLIFFSGDTVVGDFNGDGILDFAAGTTGACLLGCGAGDSVYIYLGNGDGTFTQAASSPLKAGSGISSDLDEIFYPVAGDFNGDGIADLAVSSSNSADNNVTVFLSTFSSSATATATGVAPSGKIGSSRLVDATYDGDVDYESATSNTISLSLSKVPPTVTVTPSSLSISTGESLTVIAAINGGLGNPTPTGSVTLTGGGYTSSAVVLSAGTAKVLIPAGSLAVGSDKLTVSYTPDSTSASIYNKAEGTSAAVTVIPEYIVAFSANSLSFGSVKFGAASASQSVTMTNVGTGAVSITSISVTGSDASSFVFANSCGASLAVGAACAIHGHFAPSAVGSLTAAIAITDNATGSPHSIPLSGTGTGVTSVSLSASSLSFGSVKLATASASQSVTMTNTGDAALSITSIAVNGQGASSFVFANTCGTTLAAGASCSIHGHFAPLASGALAAAITIVDDAVTSPQEIILSGTGLGPVVSLSAPTLSFGLVKVSTASASQSVTLTNTGPVALSVDSISLAGADFSSFDFANTCGTTLPAGGNCSIHGHFAPTVAGALTATIKITDNAPGSPQSIALIGTGQAQ